MLFQPIEFLCIHGKCNYPYSIEKKIEKTEKQKNIKEVKCSRSPIKSKAKETRKNPWDSRPIAHLVGCTNFVSDGHSFKYSPVIRYSLCYLDYTIGKDTNCLFLQIHSYVLYENVVSILKHNPSPNRYSKNYSTLISALKVCGSFFAY